MSQDFIANARMYAVAPGAAAAWKRLFAWLATDAGVPLTVIDHAFPAKLGELWARDDLAAAFMCGWPYLRQGARQQIVAAPVPSHSRSGGRPVYATLFAVRADSRFETLPDTFGHRFAFTIEDSHSGYNAPRQHLMAFRKSPGEALFREVVGPLTTPRRMLEAIADGRTDVGPLDSFAFDLLSRHEPQLTALVRVVAATELVPIPALMAAAGTPHDIVNALRASLLRLADAPVAAELRADLCISGFALLDPATYSIAEDWAQKAEAAGFGIIR